jgi:hypothetical protein
MRHLITIFTPNKTKVPKFRFECTFSISPSTNEIAKLVAISIFYQTTSKSRTYPSSHRCFRQTGAIFPFPKWFAFVEILVCLAFF